MTTPNVPRDAPVPPSGVVGRCYRCGARVLWAVTVKGHRQPVNPVDPDAPTVGSLVLSYGPEGLRSRARVGDEALDADERATVPHQATCDAPRVSLSQARRDAAHRLGVKA